MNHDNIKSILIVGGGTAGWLTACHLAKKLRCELPNSVNVTLIESENIPTIGVGEGTVPAIIDSLKYFGLSETDLIKDCDATFKQSIKFVDWMKPRPEQKENYYHHVFDYRGTKTFDLTPYWLMGVNGQQSYVDSVGYQGAVCDLGLAPKNITDKEFEGLNGYAYHFDAAKFSLLLAKHAVNTLGIKHIKAEVNEVTLDKEGAIESVITDKKGELTADLFIDCTGFSSLLLGQALGVKFISKNDVLFTDHALAVQVPYDSSSQPIASHTIATAKEAGWIWDIGLSERRGLGYVYSSKHTTHEQAEKVLRDYVQQTSIQNTDALTYRKIPMKVGYHDVFWKKNCVAIGLSQGFVEPLEATGLLVFDSCAKMLAEKLPVKLDSLPAVASEFNVDVRKQWDKVIDFVKLHYCLSDRDDSEFWRSNSDTTSVPQSLLTRLSYWRERPPSEHDFTSRHEIFYKVNYLYVLYGMNFKTNIDDIKYRYTEQEKAKQGFMRINNFAEQAKSTLPLHRELIEKIKQYGLQKV